MKHVDSLIVFSFNYIFDNILRKVKKEEEVPIRIFLIQNNTNLYWISSLTTQILQL